MNSTQPVSIPSKTILALSTLASGLIIVTSLLGYSLFHFNILRHDEWPVYYNQLMKLPFWQGVWAAHTGHRIVFPGLLGHINMVLFSGNLTNLVALNLAVQILAALLLVRCVSHQEMKHSERFVLTGLVLSAMLWMGYKMQLTWALGLQHTLPILGIILASMCIIRCRESLNRTAGRWWLACSMGGALLATLSYGSGPLAWPVLLILAILLRLKRKAIVTILLTGTVVILLYFLPASGDTGMTATLPGNFHSIDTALLVALGVLGNMPANVVTPYAAHYSSHVLWFARGMGLVSIGLLITFSILWWREKENRRWLLPLIGICGFVVGTALAVGMTRYIFAKTWYLHWGLAPRFGNFSGCMWAALVCGLYGLISKKIDSHWRSFTLILASLLLVVSLLPSQWTTFIKAGKEKLRSEKASLSLATGVVDRKTMFINFWYPNPEIVFRLSKYLEKHHLTVFREPWTHWMETKITTKDQPRQSISWSLTKIKHLKNGWEFNARMAAPHKGSLTVGLDNNGRIRAIAKPIGLTHTQIKSERGEYGTWLSLLRGLNPELPIILGWGRSWSGYVIAPYKPRRLHYYLINQKKKVIADIRLKHRLSQR